jgi:hypothetical protein
VRKLCKEFSEGIVLEVTFRLGPELGILFIKLDRWGTSVSIVSGYGLDDRAIEVQYLAGAEDFSSNVCVQTSSGAHPASCTMGTGGPFHEGKARPGHDADQSPPSNDVVVNA